jgi:1,2-diacylglycerol 3-alpha-glucosyltransferase
MKILMISTDRNIFDKKSAVADRMRDYAILVEELHIIVFSIKTGKIDHDETIRLADNGYIYPTASSSRWRYIMDALKIGRTILGETIKGGKRTLVELREQYEHPDQRFAPYLITTQDPFETGLVGYKLAEQFRVKLQIQIHTDFLSPYFYKANFLNLARMFIARYVLPKADCIRVVSERVKQSILSCKKIKLKTEPRVLPILVDIDKFKQEVDKEKIASIRKRYPRFDFIVLAVGRFSMEKNFSLAIRAFREVLRQHPRAGLLIIGQGEQEKMLLNLAYKLGIIDSVSIEPWQDDLRPYYAVADVYLLTSNYEGYSMSLVEAASSGCPLVSTDVGIASAIVKQSNGFLCPVGDVKCIAESISEIIKDAPKRMMFKNNAKASALQFVLTKQEYLEQMNKLWLTC